MISYFFPNGEGIRIRIHPVLTPPLKKKDFTRNVSRRSVFLSNRRAQANKKSGRLRIRFFRYPV